MPRTCTVCAHPERAEIDSALVSGESTRQIAGRYGSLSRAAIRRHADSHLPETLLKSRQAEELSASERLAGELEEVKADVRRLKVSAEREGDYKTALTGCDKALKALELQGKLAQLIDDSPKVNILIAPRVQAVILAALESHPEARLDVAEALAALDGLGSPRSEGGSP